jgi:hypothetical protein
VRFPPATRLTNRRVGKSGQPREYVSHLLRRTYRDGSKVKHETLANLSPLPDAAIEAVRAALAGKTLVVAGEGLEVTGSLPHGHVAAVHAQATALGLPGLLGPAGRDRDIALALIIARVCRPASKLATTRWWADTTLADDLGVAEASIDEVYAAMDWLAGRQEAIETKLVRTHLSGPVTPTVSPCSTFPPHGPAVSAAPWRPAGTPATVRNTCPRSSTGC